MVRATPVWSPQAVAMGLEAPMAQDTVVVYTVGYENLTPGRLARVLNEHGIRRLVDVRLQPMSRKRGFSVYALFEGMRKAGIKYEHAGDLGNPPEVRALFQNGFLDQGRHRYRKIIENGKSDAVDLILGISRLEPIALMCLEADADRCHRLVIAEVMKERAGAGFRIEHL
jgi:uncharacterized protein (DUF488 family)